MKAIVYTKFGNSDVIKIIEIEKPIVIEDEILIKSYAVSVNAADIKYRKGLMQQRMPVDLPYIPGLDVAGIVEAVGSNVSRLKIGDRVFGGKHGNTYAEYVTLKESNAAIIPDNISFNEAVSFVVPAVTACSFLLDYGNVSNGQRVLIQGISGGTGQVILQLAKSLELYVIGTSSTSGISRVKFLGADEVIDYKNEDFTKIVNNIDLVIDLVGGDVQINSFKTLKKGGKLLSGSMVPSQELAKQYSVDAKFISSTYSYKKLDFVMKLLEENKIKLQIIKTIPFEHAAKAQDLFSEGGINGKIVLEFN